MDEETSPSWTDIKQRARLLTPQGNYRASLLDPDAYVLQEGVARYHSNDRVMETHSASSNHRDANVSDDMINITDRDCRNRHNLQRSCRNTPNSSSSEDNSLHRDCRISHNINRNCSNNHHFSPMEDSSSTSKCNNNQSRSTASSATSDISANASATCASESLINSETSNYNCNCNIASRTDFVHNMCSLEDMETSESSTTSHSHLHCDELDDRGTSFGRGWWLSQQSRERRNSEPSHRAADDGKDFGSGWWKSPKKSNTASRETRNPKRDTSAPPGDKRKRLRNNSNGDSSSSFGSGWWVGRLDTSVGNNKDSKPKSSKNGLSKNNNCNCSSDASRQTSKSYGCRPKCRKCSTVVSSRSATVTNPVLDVVPYKDNFSAELAIEFSIQANFFKKEILAEEEEHGRTISMSFQSVPGLWKASLGGSRTSLLVQVISRSSERRKAANVKDIHGLHTVVVFKFLKSGEEIPGVGEENAFIFMRGVHWHEFRNGRLGIKMKKREDVLVSQ